MQIGKLQIKVSRALGLAEACRMCIEWPEYRKEGMIKNLDEIIDILKEITDADNQTKDKE